MTTSDQRPALSQLLADLENPLEQVRQAALLALERFPAVSIVRPLRRVAVTDPSVSVRLEARRILRVAAKELFGGEAGQSAEAPLERLEALLAAPEPGLRVKAVRALALKLEPKAADLLVRVLDTEPEAFVRASALLALAAVAGPQAIPHIYPFLSAEDPRLRATAVEALEATGDPRVLEHLLPLLQDQHHRVRAVAARAVQAQDPEAVLACVDAMLADVQEMSVRSAAFVLRYFAEDSALPRLRERLGDERTGVAQMALGSLQHMARAGSTRATQLLARQREAAAPVATSATAWLVSTASPVQQPIEARLKSPSPEERLAAVRQAVRAGREDLIDALRAAREVEPDPRVLATLVSAVGLLGTGDDVRWLRHLLTSEDARLRANCVEAIGLLSRVRKVPLLTKYLTDPNNRVRANAVVALHGAPNVDVLPVLREMAGGMSPLHARSAIWAATTIGSPATVQVLADLLKHEDAQVATRARQALEELAEVMPEAAAALPKTYANESAPEPAAPDPELEKLMFDMRHESPSVRQDAAKKLAGRKDPSLLPQLRALLHDDDPGVRRSAREAGRALLNAVAPRAGSPAVLGQFEEQLAQSPETARQALERVLDVALSCGVTATAEALTERLRVEKAPFVRAGLLSALGMVGDERAAPLLKELAKDPDARVRANAVDALELLGGAQDVSAAIACLADPDPRVRAAAIAASTGFQREPFVTHLRQMLASETTAERAAGLYALQAVLIPERGELLREYLLRESQPKLYESAADALVKELAGDVVALERILAQIGEGDKQRHLERCIRRLTEGFVNTQTLDKTSISGVWGSFSSMGQLLDMKNAGQLTPDVLRDVLLKEKDPISVAFLLEEAAAQRLPDAAELAQPFTHSKDRKIRLAAVEALGKVGTEDASEAIAFLVRDRDPEVSRKAVECLEKLAPEAAVAGIRALLETAHPWAVKHGLELLERRGDPAGLELALTVLALGGDPGLVEPLMRLVRAWGSEATLPVLAGYYQRAAVNDRPLVRELGSALVEARGLDAEVLKVHFREDAPVVATPMHTGRTLPRVPSARSSTANRRVLPRTERPAPGFENLQLVGAAGLMAVVLAIIVSASGSGRVPGNQAGLPPASAKPSAPAVHVEFGPGPSREVSFGGPAAAAPLADFMPKPPTLEEVKAAMKVALAAKGIRSDAILSLMALDRCQPGYRLEIARAREALLHKQYDEAIKIMEAALANCDPEHLVARMQILRSFELIAREARRYDLIPSIRKQMKEAGELFIKTLQKAAADGDIPEDKLKIVLAKMEAQEKERASVRKATDWLAGADTDANPVQNLEEN